MEKEKRKEILSKCTVIKIESISRSEYDSLLRKSMVWKDYERHSIGRKDKPPQNNIHIDDNDENMFVEYCFEEHEVVIASFGSKCIDTRNYDFFKSQREENDELEFWLNEIDRQKGGK